MKSFTVSKEYNQFSLYRAIKKNFTQVPDSAIQKAFRKKDIKVNGKRVAKDTLVYQGDVVELYISDQILEASKDHTIKKNVDIPIIYEDQHVLVIYKPKGIPSDKDQNLREQTVIDRLTELKQSTLKTYKLYPCHRLDRNTDGLMLVAKTPQSQMAALDGFRLGQVHKHYQTLVIGIPTPKEQVLEAYLFKDRIQGIVKIYPSPKKGTSKIVTGYKVKKSISLPQNVASQAEITHISLLDIELFTGKTHQIRAHMAFIGHPLVGDGKYGINTINRVLGQKSQILTAYKMAFSLDQHNLLSYLNQQIFEIVPELPRMPFKAL